MSSQVVIPLSDDKSDERDVDIESDEYDCQSYSPGSEQYSQQVDKRAHYNALERKRRDDIKDSFSELRDSVPSLQGQKASDGSRCQVSRTLTLKRAADYIQFMMRKNTAHQQDIDDLKKQNENLQTQIASLHKAKTLQMGGLCTQAEAGKHQKEESDGLDIGEKNMKEKRASKKMKMSM